VSEGHTPPDGISKRGASPPWWFYIMLVPSLGGAVTGGMSVARSDAPQDLAAQVAATNNEVKALSAKIDVLTVTVGTSQGQAARDVERIDKTLEDFEKRLRFLEGRRIPK